MNEISVNTPHGLAIRACQHKRAAEARHQIKTLQANTAIGTPHQRLCWAQALLFLSLVLFDEAEQQLVVAGPPRPAEVAEHLRCMKGSDV